MGSITIIGTKYCANGFDYLIKASRIVQPEEQCLFLVIDAHSSEVVLHNGKQRLGLVAPEEALEVRDVLRDIMMEKGADHVLVCRKGFVPPVSEGSFRGFSSFKVDPVYYVYERLARKFSKKYLKE